MQLTFLRGGGYLLVSAVHTTWTAQLDEFLISILKGKLAGAPLIKQILRVETVSNPEGQTASYICYRDAEGEVHTRPSLKPTHSKLGIWLRRHQHKEDQLQICLGPDGQFFASSSHGYRWDGVSAEFQVEMQSIMRGGGGWQLGWEPSGACFGVNGSFLILCKGGKHLIWSRNFQENYNDLFKTLEEHFWDKDVACGYKYITINPYVANEWLVVWNDDDVDFNLPPAFMQLLDPSLPREPDAPSNKAAELDALETASSGLYMAAMRSFQSGESDRKSASEKSTTSSTQRPAAQPVYPPTNPQLPQSYPRPSHQPTVQWGSPQHLNMHQVMQGLKIAHKITEKLSGSGSGSGGFGIFDGGSSIPNGGGMFNGGGSSGGLLNAMGIDPVSAAINIGGGGGAGGSLMMQGNCTVI